MGELTPVTPSSYGVTKMVSVLVSVADPAFPMSMLLKQLGMEAEVGIDPSPIKRKGMRLEKYCRCKCLTINNLEARVEIGQTLDRAVHYATR
jgi:hypothetical protein